MSTWLRQTRTRGRWRSYAGQPKQVVAMRSIVSQTPGTK